MSGDGLRRVRCGWIRRAAENAMVTTVFDGQFEGLMRCGYAQVRIWGVEVFIICVFRRSPWAPIIWAPYMQ